MHPKGIRWLLFLMAFLASPAGVLSRVPGSALALGSNPYWGSWGNCNSWIPHGWSSTWWNYYPSSSWGGSVHIWSGKIPADTGESKWLRRSEPHPARVTRLRSTIIGARPRGSWLEVATHSGSMSPLTGGGKSSQQSIWCG